MILDRIKSDRITALKAGNHTVVKYLSTLYSEAVMVGKNNGNRESTDDEVISTIRKFKNSIEETIKALEIGGEINKNKIETLKEESKIYDNYLPSQLTKEELTNLVSCVIKNNNIVDLKGMGLIMKYMREHYSGRFEGKIVNEIAKDILNIRG